MGKHIVIDLVLHILMFVKFSYIMKIVYCQKQNVYCKYEYFQLKILKVSYTIFNGSAEIYISRTANGRKGIIFRRVYKQLLHIATGIQHQKDEVLWMCIK